MRSRPSNDGQRFVDTDVDEQIPKSRNCVGCPGGVTDDCDALGANDRRHGLIGRDWRHVHEDVVERFRGLVDSGFEPCRRLGGFRAGNSFERSKCRTDRHAPGCHVRDVDQSLAKRPVIEAPIGHVRCEVSPKVIGHPLGRERGVQYGHASVVPGETNRRFERQASRSSPASCAAERECIGSHRAVLPVMVFTLSCSGR